MKILYNDIENKFCKGKPLYIQNIVFKFTFEIIKNIFENVIKCYIITNELIYKINLTTR